MSQFKYQQLFDHIKNEIISGERKAGDKLPDINELKELSGMSLITISRALRELQQSGYIKRIKGQGSFICNIYTSISDKNSLSHERFISCIIPYDFTNSDFINNIEATCRKNNFMLTVQNSQFSAKLERKMILHAQKHGAAGIIIYPVTGTDNIDLYSKLIIDNFPFVVIDRKLDALEHPFVCCANTEAFYKITKYILNKGHRRIGLICENLSLSSTHDRFRGYCQALMDSWIAVDKSLVMDCFTAPVDKPDERVIKEMLIKFISDPLDVTAITCTNDTVASIVIQQANTMGIKIPEDLSVTGFDNLYFCSLLHPPLTTMTQPFMEIGDRATELLISMIEKKKIINKTILCQAEIVERSSVIAVSKPS